MPETKQLLRQARDRIAPPPDVLGGLERRRRHQENVKRTAAVVVGIVVALVGLGGWFALERNEAPTPAVPSRELGIFEPVAGRIVYVNETEVGDLGYDPGLWAIDPNGPADSTEGPTVANDVASTLVRFGQSDMVPLGWSRDGTELLFVRGVGNGQFELFPKDHLYILHADGSETRLTADPISFGGAAISADGSRVVFAAWGDELGLYVVDAEGGRPVRLPLPGAEGIVADPTISPDGTRIAYVDSGESENHVWVMGADGGNAREILANEQTQVGGVGSLQWSPAGDHILGVARSSEGTNSIYTFASDGFDFTRVITSALSPYWSPDGSQIAYTIECDLTDVSCGGLAIADADGSNVREFGFAASGPWHPGVSATGEPLPTPVETTTPAETPTPDTTTAPAVPLRSWGLLDGEVTFTAARPWYQFSDFGPGTIALVEPDLSADLAVLADPLPVETGCRPGSAPADAEALADSIRSDPDFEVAAPVVAVEVGGMEALSIDVVAAQGASVCDYMGGPLVLREPSGDARPMGPSLGSKQHLRLYLLDLPEGMSARILAIAIKGPKAGFETVLDETDPIVESFEFHVR
jgi:hypothetical protein